MDRVFLPKHKAFNQQNISKMRLIDDGSFQQTPQVDDSILSEFHQKLGLNTRRYDYLDEVWEKVAEEDERVDATEVTEQINKKKMDTPSSKPAPTQQHPPPTLIAPKAIDVMAHVSKNPVLKKQNPLSTTKFLRALSETESDDD